MDPLYELLAPYFERPDSPYLALSPPAADSPQTVNYLERLSKLSLVDITASEPTSLVQSAQAHLRSLQALSKRSHKAVIASAVHTASFGSLLPVVEAQAGALQHDVPELESAASEFAQKYDRSTENAVLDRRKQALLLSRNIDRASDVMDLPALLSSTVTAAQTASTASVSATSTSYASALDLHAHIKRLSSLYPRSRLVSDISRQAEVEMQTLPTILIASLQSPTLKLAGAMRTIGWLRRVAPELADDGHQAKPAALSTKAFDRSADTTSSDGTLGALFLMCRLHTLNNTLEALEPLRELADQETARRTSGVHSKLLRQNVSASALGSQSERYLKRYIEIFREQSFSIVSMYKSIFPTGLPSADEGAHHAGDSVEHAEENGERASDFDDALLPLPSPVSTFTLHLVDLLSATLRTYLPNIADPPARESLLTQVLYCAGSLSRLGAEFGMMLAILADELRPEAATDTSPSESDHEPEWVQVMRKHRVQASRLRVLARGVSGSATTTTTMATLSRKDSGEEGGSKGSPSA